MKIKVNNLAFSMLLGLSLISSNLLADENDKWATKWAAITNKTEEIDIFDHWDICGIKYRLRRYSDLYQCLDLVEERARNIKKEHLNNFKRYTPFVANWMRFTTYYELGMMVEARAAAVASLALAPSETHMELSSDNPVSMLILMLERLDWGGKNPAALEYKYPNIFADLKGGLASIDYVDGNIEAGDENLSALKEMEGAAITAGLIKRRRYEFKSAIQKKVADVNFIRGDYAAVMAHYRGLAKERDANRGENIAKGVAAGTLLVGVNVAAAVLNPIGFLLEKAINVSFALATDYRDYYTRLEGIASAYMLATSMSNTGNSGDAKLIFDQLLKIDELKQLGAFHWRVLYQRGLISSKEGDTDAAVEYFKRSAEAIEKVRSTISVEAAKIGFSGDKQAVYHELVKALASKGDWVGAFEYAERAKARALVDLLSQQDKISPPPNIDEKVLSLLAQAEAKEAPLSILESDPQTRALAIAARQELSKKAPEVASLVSVTPVPIQEIAAKLGPQETLVNYFNTGDAMYALVLNGANIKGYKLDSVGLEGEVRSFRESLEKSEATADAQAKKLYVRLIAPIAGELKGNRVTFSPHAALHYLPFGALHDGKQYLVEKYSIRVTPSANALAYVKTDKPSKPGKLLALGNPDLNQTSLDLPGAQKEAVQVASVFPASKVLVRKDANKEAIKELGNGFSILHIASHGQFDADKPLNSGLLLAGNGPDEGRLTVSDLYKMRLDTELVTLSACETGLGKVANGDDVVGLNRGFMYAGARSIVSSLWQVDDAATEKLMTNFYRNLAKKMDQREALRLAQVETKKAYPHPFFWAAFQITGAAN